MKFSLVIISLISFLLVAPAAAQVDIEQLPGWPKNVPENVTFAQSRGLVMADVDGDGNLDVVVGTTAQKLYAWNGVGTKLFESNLTGLAQYPVAVGDVVGDDAPEIVVATRSGVGGSPIPKLHVFSGGGTLLHSTTLAHEGSMHMSPTLVNLDGDPKLEIIIGEHGNQTGWVYALNGDLTTLNGWPKTLDYVPATGAAVGDIDDDGQVEIVICSFYSVYAYEIDGTLLSGFPVTYSGQSHSYDSPALAPLSGKGDLQILVATHGDSNQVHAINPDGTELAGWPYDLGDAWSFSEPAVGDVDGNGDLEVVVGHAGGSIAAENLYVINHDGTDLAPFPLLLQNSIEGNFVLADFTGDLRLEILYTDNNAEEGRGNVFAVNADGDALDGWPLRVGGWTYLNGATIADMDGDGVPEFGVLGYFESTLSVNLFRTDDYFLGQGGVHWRTHQADSRHTGRYRPVMADDDDDDTTGDDDTIDDDDADDDTINDDDAADDDATDDDDDTIDDDDMDDDTNSDDDDNDNDSGSCCG